MKTLKWISALGNLVEGQKELYELHSTLQSAPCGQTSLDYWEKQGKFGHGTYSDIDWKAMGKAMAKVTISRRHWVAKHSSGFCGTSKMMLLWKKRATDICLCCLQEVEDTTHVWYYQGSDQAITFPNRYFIRLPADPFRGT
jgi:hypothetical protein